MDKLRIKDVSEDIALEKDLIRDLANHRTKRKDKKIDSDSGETMRRTTEDKKSEVPQQYRHISHRDVGRPVHVRGYGPGILMYWGQYHKTKRNRAGVAFNRPIGLNNGTIEGRLYFRCPDKHGVLVNPTKISFLSEQEIAIASKSGQLIHPSPINRTEQNRTRKDAQFNQDTQLNTEINQRSVSSSNSSHIPRANEATLPKQRVSGQPLSQINRMENPASAADTISISSSFSIISMSAMQNCDENLDTFSLSSRTSVCSSVSSSTCHDFVHVPVDVA